jgi:peroxiredoxin
MALPVGTKAPNFTLKTRSDGENRDVHLSDNLGKQNVVLLFFPGAFTHVCHKEMCDFTEMLPSYIEMNAQVYGISNDTPYALEEWAKQLNIGFPLLGDFQKEVTKEYDVVWPNFSGLGPGCARAVFVIDKEGIIRYSEQTPTLLDLPDYDAVAAAVKGLA